MQQLLTGLAAACALALFASAGQACDFHDQQVTASVPAEEVVAMSTVSDATPVVIETTDAAPATTECPAGETDCVPTGK